MTSSHRPLVAALCTAAAVLLLSGRAVNPYDEGIILTGALRVAHGEVPHRDFYANYGPAPFYLLGALFDLAGPSAWIHRVLDACIRGAIAGVLWALLSLHVGRTSAVITTIAACVWLASVGPAGYPVYGAMLGLLLTVLLLARATTRGPAGPRLRTFFAAGLATAAAAFFRYDVGFVLAVTALLGLGLLQRDRKRPDIGRELAAYAVGAGGPVALLLSAWAAVGALPGFWHDVVAFPARHYAAMRGLPFPPVSWMFSPEGVMDLAIVLPVLLSTLGLASLMPARAHAASRPAPGQGQDPAHGARTLLLLLCVATLGAWTKGLVRTSVSHMQLALIPSLASCALLVARRDALNVAARHLPTALAIAVLLSTAGAAMATWPERLETWPWAITGLARSDPSTDSPVDAEPQREGLGPPGAEHYLLVEETRRAAARDLRMHLAPGERTFVGTGRHDKVFANDVSAYFLAQRLPATHWHHYDPGLQTSERVQRQMIDELERVRPRLVMLDASFDEVVEPNASARSSGVRLLDDYLRAHYVGVRSYGAITVAERQR